MAHYCWKRQFKGTKIAVKNVMILNLKKKIFKLQKEFIFVKDVIMNFMKEIRHVFLLYVAINYNQI